MSSREYLLARLDCTRKDLNEVLDHFADADICWAPAQGMRPVGELLAEIARKEMEIVGYLKDGEWPDEEPDPFEPNAPLDEVRRGLDAMRELTKEYIAGLKEEELEEVIDLPEPWWEALRLTHCPRSEMLRNISVHEWYHTGQLVIYLWFRGERPRDW